jgi:hypothetical protein
LVAWWRGCISYTVTHHFEASGTLVITCRLAHSLLQSTPLPHCATLCAQAKSDQILLYFHPCFDSPSRIRLTRRVACRSRRRIRGAQEDPLPKGMKGRSSALVPFLRHARGELERRARWRRKGSACRKRARERFCQVRGKRMVW